MGTTASWVAVKESASESTVVDALLAIGLEPRGQHAEWHWAKPSPFRGLPPGGLEALVTEIAGRCDAAAFGGWVADSDCGYLVFASTEGETQARICINTPLPFGEPAEGVSDSWTDLDARLAAFSGLAEWSQKYASTTVDANQLLNEMPGSPDSSLPPDAPTYGGESPWWEENAEHGWVFAEDAVWLIFRRLGIASPFQFV